MSAVPASGRPGTEDLRSWVIDACRQLGVPVEAADDDFFACGGTSLSAVKLIARAEQEFGEDALLPEELFERSAVGQIADSILRNRLSGAAADA